MPPISSNVKMNSMGDYAEGAHGEERHANWRLERLDVMPERCQCTIARNSYKS